MRKSKNQGYEIPYIVRGNMANCYTQTHRKHLKALFMDRTIGTWKATDSNGKDIAI